MDNKELVVVVSPLELKHTGDNKVFVARIRALGLTGYGNTLDEAVLSLRKMFATYVDLHRRAGTLEARLTKSKLEWCYESEYCGTKPVLVLAADGTNRVIQPSRQSAG